MAYILGFFVADGTVNEITQTVSFAQKDPNILLKIREEIGSNQPLYYNKKTNVHLLNLNSKILKEDLMYIHGILPNKSRTIEFPKVPKEYLSHFIRGYFDGDGHIYPSRHYLCFVGGSKSFMNSLVNIFKEKGFKHKLIEVDKNYRLYITNTKSVLNFGNWIYQDKELYLARKFDKFRLCPSKTIS
ncbi:LAGLIDADG family homing endonuclease [Alkalihalobacillus sp. 1P02AB]|uniref:LAGLIDADG family homing endonuclease n=1 Tax=Alkalihalobacillus sp. 1P02AB TaxID=3132260 RepID=UPI0039A711CA